MLAAWGLALAEASQLVAGTSLSVAPPLGVLVGLWTLVALGSLPLSLAIVLYRKRHPSESQSSKASEDTHPSPSWSRALAAALLLLGGLLLHRLQVVLEDRSSETLMLGSLLAVLLGTPILLATHRAAGRVLGPRLHGLSRPRVALISSSMVIPAALGLLLSTLGHHQDFVRELVTHSAWGDWLALAAPGGIGLLGALWATSGRLGWVSSQGASRGGTGLLGLVLALPITGLLVGVLGYRLLQPAEARALRDRCLYSGALVRSALLMGVPAPEPDTPSEVRACRPNVALATPGSLGTVRADAPDILLITVDGLRFDHTSLLPSSAHPNTPRLLEHAARAAVFSRAYTAAPSTRAAFRSVFTGLLPGQIQTPYDATFPWGVTLTPQQPTLAAYLRDAGYQTIALISKPKAFPLSSHALLGFSEVDDTPTPYHTRYRHSAQLKVSRIIGRLAEPPGDGRPPRFVWTHFIEPHFPYTRGPNDDPSSSSGGHEGRHDQAVRFIDAQLDRLLRFALAPERRDRTIVVIAADHGEAFGEHANSRHGATVFEEEIHIPLLFFGPGIIAGTRSTAVSLVDLLPTLLDLAGLEPAHGVCGTGWADALRGGGEPQAQPVYVAALPDGTERYHQLAFLLGHEKLIVDGETGATQRFDLQRDPREQHPDTDSARVDALREALSAFLRERGLPSP